jgi:predicted Zn-dependent protease with MMP-like domain
LHQGSPAVTLHLHQAAPPAPAPEIRVSDEYARLVARSWDAYHEGDATTGVTLARDAITAAPRDGRGYYALACNLERLGQLTKADRAFVRAAQSQHEPHPLPYRVGWRHFKEAVGRAADSLPQELREALEEIDLVLADYPGSEQISNDQGYELLGLFAGPTKADLQDPDPAAGELTTRIYLYRRAHEHIATSAGEFDEELRRTLYHELGHFLGFDEDDMDRFGLD